MKVLFLSDNFPPEANAPAIRTHEHLREWVKAGHDVTVVTCAPNFPRGRVYEGYRNRIFERDELDGIKIVRVWTYIAANEGSLKRILDYVSFMLSAIDGALPGGGGSDKFRIKIWEVGNGGGVVYDNKIGAGDEEDPTTEIGKGNIIIHKK